MDKRNIGAYQYPTFLMMNYQNLRWNIIKE